MEWDNNTKVCIVGLGYVGLPLASLASTVAQVTGFDVDADKISKLTQKICPIEDHFTQKVFSNSQFHPTTDPSCISKAKIVVVCVPTPINSKHEPDLSILKAATSTIAKHLQKGQLIIIESTVHPGTTDEIVIPLLKQSGLELGIDFNVAYCPERIDPGNDTWNLHNIPRVLGASGVGAAQYAKQFYEQFIDAEIKILSTIKACEAVKILENTFRDVNIAFINEMAKSFDSLGINIHEVIKGAATKPFGFMPFYPGPGVGGHCIPVDPYYLIEKARSTGFNHEFLSLARKINLSMPSYVVEKLQNQLNNFGKTLKGSRIGVLGIAYKKDIDDARESPSLEVCELLREKGAFIETFDPFLPSHCSTPSLEALLSVVDHIVVLTNHSQFKQITTKNLQEHSILSVLDTRRCLDSKNITSRGISYSSIGS